MKLFVGLGIALVALGRNLLRSALAMVGLIIGVAAVLTMIALGRGAREAVTDEMTSAGTNLVFVRAGNYTRGGDAVNIPSGFGKATTLVPEDADAIASIPGVAHVNREVDDRAPLAVGDAKTFSPVLGCDADYVDVYDATINAGRFFDEAEVRAGENVIVLSESVREKLFPDGRDPSSHDVRLGDVDFTVVGVVRDGERVLVPYTALQSVLGIDYLHGITAASEQAGDASGIAEEARRLLRERHGLDDPALVDDLPQATDRFAMKGTGAVPDDFTVRTEASQALTQGLYTTAAAFVLASMPRLDEISSEEMVNTLTRANSTMAFLLAGIAAVSLVVGGIGIMNIMLLAVTERTMEIGLRMSVGAKRRDVLSQFLLESVLLGLFGGVVGIAFGFASAGALTRFLGWPTYVSGEAVALAFGLAFAVGVLFGYYPAFRASRLDPIDALRYE